MEQRIDKNERIELRKMMRPSILMAAVFFIVITAVNLSFYYRDILTRTEGLGRPPLSQLIVIEIFAMFIGLSIFYFLSKAFIKDLTAGIKKVEVHAITHKFIKLENGNRLPTFKLKNALTVTVDQHYFHNVSIGEKIVVEYLPASSHILKVRKYTNHL